MELLPPPPEAHKRRATDLTRDDRIRIATLREEGFTYKQISQRINCTPRQAEYACQHPLTPKKRKGRPSMLTQEQIDEIITWICYSKANRRASWMQIPILMGLNVSYYCVRTALRNAGFSRRVARRKPPISEKNRRARLAWAIEHVGWTMEQWKKILWSDETWVNGDRHTKTYVTRRAGEEWDPTCIVERWQRRKGWMFWGCFHGRIKGPGLFWEKEWGSINEESYRAHIVPLIDGWIHLHADQELIFMQDGASSHSARGTIQDLLERGVVCMKWPAYSPDLNPIEMVWNKMKDWIQDQYEDTLITYNPLREAVAAAWEAVEEDYLEELLATMPARCQAVIDADGLQTRW